jgi:hypothetical protein
MIRHLALRVASLGLSLLSAAPLRGIVLSQETNAKPAPSVPNQLTSAEQSAGWRLLFDGKTLKGWHGLGFKETPPGLWAVEDGAIKHIEKGKGPVQPDGQPLTGMDLISDAAYQDFELSWEWKIAVAGNSGLKYNVSEQLSTQMPPPHAAKGWEYQMNDDERNEDNALATHRSGALYDMIPAGENKRINPAGQWNRSMIVFRGNHGEHWLNGEKILEYEIGSPQFDSAFAKSKYKNYPAWFPVRRRGQIVLQDHDDVVWFRDIKIRELRQTRFEPQRTQRTRRTAAREVARTTSRDSLGTTSGSSARWSFLRQFP